MCLLFSIAFPVLFVSSRIDQVGFDTVSVTVIAVSITVIASLMFYVLVPRRRKQLLQLQGGCPACGRLLLGKRSGAVSHRAVSGLWKSGFTLITPPNSRQSQFEPALGAGDLLAHLKR